MKDPTYQSQFLMDPLANKLAPLIGAAINKERVRGEIVQLAIAMQLHGVDPVPLDFSGVAKFVDRQK